MEFNTPMHSLYTIYTIRRRAVFRIRSMCLFGGQQSNNDVIAHLSSQGIIGNNALLLFAATDYYHPSACVCEDSFGVSFKLMQSAGC